MNTQITIATGTTNPNQVATEALLSPRAALKLRSLRQSKDDLYGLLRVALDQAEELRSKIASIESELSGRQHPRQNRDHVAESTLEAELDAHRAKLAATLETIAARTSAWHGANYTVQGVESYLSEIAPTRAQQARQKLEAIRNAEATKAAATARRPAPALPVTRLDVERFVAANPDLGFPDAPEVMLKDRAPLVEQLAAVRRKILEAGAAMHEIESAPVPSSEAKAMARRQIEARAAAPSIGWLLDGAKVFEWPDDPDSERHEPDVLGLLCWVHGPAMIAKAEAEIDQLADDENALTDAERAKRLAAVKAERLELERREEAVIETIGGGIARRPEMDPRAILGIEGPEPRDG
jgi:hypothetical protein